MRRTDLHDEADTGGELVATDLVLEFGIARQVPLAADIAEADVLILVLHEEVFPALQLVELLVVPEPVALADEHRAAAVGADRDEVEVRTVERIALDGDWREIVERNRLDVLEVQEVGERSRRLVTAELEVVVSANVYAPYLQRICKCWSE